MIIDKWGDRGRLSVGDMSCEDDPRGREFVGGVELGVPTGEFDATPWGMKQGRAPRAEYGTWGFWVTIWRWGIRVALRGPIVGRYPPDEPPAGHTDDDRRHEYDHHGGYAAENHLAVEPVCTICHADREVRRRGRQHQN